MGLIMIAVAIPLMIFYASHSELESFEDFYGYNKYSLGNIGGSTALCFIAHSNKIPMTLMCPSGVISIDATSEKTGEMIFDLGIIPNQSPINTYCSNQAFKDPANCSSLLKMDTLRSVLV